MNIEMWTYYDIQPGNNPLPFGKDYIAAIFAGFIPGCQYAAFHQDAEQYTVKIVMTQNMVGCCKSLRAIIKQKN